MKPVVIGWDVGGANVKAVRVAFAGGDLVTGVRRTALLGTARWGDALRSGAAGDAPEARVVVRPVALWREPDRLAAVLADIGARLGAADVMGITMTAELADCFRTKQEGVRFVLDSFRRAFPDLVVWVYGLDGSFHALEAARRQPIVFAAANWLATASWVAQRIPDALLLDIGSTTTDIVPIVGGRVRARGRKDTERLALGELVYTGILRTPVCALVRRVPVRGAWCRVAAEHFAIAADAYLWLGRLEPAEYACDTPDGRGTTRRDSGRRLARVVCADDESLSDDDITSIARRVAAAQRQVIATAIDDVLARLGDEAPYRAVIAGSGHRLAATVARRTGLEVARLEDSFAYGLSEPSGDAALFTHPEGPRDGADLAAAAPAAAVAYLLGQALSFSPPVEG